MRQLMWFRTDLRVADNVALYEACRAATDGVVAVFLACPSQWRRHDWAPVRVELVLRTLAELSSTLAAKNIPLRILDADRFAEAPRALLRVAEEHKCDALYFNEEYEADERERDDDARSLFESRGLVVRSFCDQVTVAPGAVRTGEGGFYSVYSPFRRAWLRAVVEGGGIEVRPAPGRQRDIGVEPSPVPTAVAGFRSEVPAALWPGGERHAETRLRRFIADRIERYHERRDVPAEMGTSALSPYLAVGAISARRCLAAAAEANGGVLDARKQNGATTWISELIWREFYTHVLVGFPRVCRNRAFRAETDLLEWRDDPEELERWRTGRTGVPIVDAGMRQMAATGWMHNRARMIVAMYLTKDLFIYWRLGEEHFMRSLVDGHFANNNGGWQWSASTGTDAAPYFRMFNPVSQSRKFDPTGEYIRAWVPELRALDDRAIHDPSSLPPAARARLDYPPPLVHHAFARRRVMEAFRALRAEA